MVTNKDANVINGDFSILVNMFLYNLKLLKNNMHKFMDHFCTDFNSLL